MGQRVLLTASDGRVMYQEVESRVHLLILLLYALVPALQEVQPPYWVHFCSVLFLIPDPTLPDTPHTVVTTRGAPMCEMGLGG